MEASIKEPNIKYFVRLLQCAARYGDDLCMHATKRSWDLSVTNSSKSAFCLFTLAPSFFAKYKTTGTPEQQRRGVRCRLYVKSVLAVIGKASSVNAVEHIHLKIIDPEGGLRVQTDDDEESDDDVRVPERSAKLEIKLVYHHGIIKKHFLHLQSSDFLRAIMDTDSSPCGFQISAKTLRDWLDHFSIAFTSAAGANGAVKGDSQLAWRFSPSEVRVKNFEALNTSPLMTEINIDVAEFQDYDIVSDDGFVDLALPMREFKATLQLAEQFGMELDFFFSEATQPLAIISRFVGPDKTGTEMELFNILCVIATTTCEGAFGAGPQSNGTSRQASEKPSRAETPSRARRRADGSSRSSRPRASLSMTAEPSTRAPSTVTVVMDPDALSRGVSQRATQTGLSQAMMSQTLGDTTEPLFLPGGTQGSVRMTQAEVLEMAGINEDDLEAMMDDLDEEGEPPAQEVETANYGETEPPKEEMELDAPADWSEIDFDNLPPNQMSTQRQDIAAAQARLGQSPRQRAQSALDVTSTTRPPPFSPRSQRNPRSSAAASRSRSRSPQRVFEPDETIFGPPPSRSLDPTQVDDEEFGPDPVESTQPDGRKYTSLFDD